MWSTRSSGDKVILSILFMDTKRILTQTFGVVGAVLEKDGHILLVKENNAAHPDHGKWNHPAGWIDVGENPVEAAQREVLEETGFTFVAEYILGIYSLVRQDLKKELKATPQSIKILFIGKILDKAPRQLLGDTSEVKWFLPDEIYQMNAATLRDLDIKTAVRDYFDGKRYPLELLRHSVSK